MGNYTNMEILICALMFALGWFLGGLPTRKYRNKNN